MIGKRIELFYHLFTYTTERAKNVIGLKVGNAKRSHLIFT